mmetsp:Transcript_78586/g.124035  ORF Transcript_78586/g.124035 Transcript_78586/m.124035 type:complete len:87 (-) Transcript_78586:785-1045(-)
MEATQWRQNQSFPDVRYVWKWLHACRVLEIFAVTETVKDGSATLAFRSMWLLSLLTLAFQFPPFAVPAALDLCLHFAGKAFRKATC